MIYNWRTAYCCVTLLVTAFAVHAEDLQYFGPDAQRGACAAVAVGDGPLVHTTQLLPLATSGELAGRGDVAQQAEQVLANIDSILKSASSNLEQLIKLNVYIADPDGAEKVQAVLAKQFSGAHKPAVSYVQTRLRHKDALVAMDAVAVAGGEAPRAVTLQPAAESSKAGEAPSAIAPAGTRIYVAGQAEKGESLAEATRKTLESLRNTVRYLGRREADIVQLKAFLSPMSDVDAVREEMKSFFDQRPVPPLVCVEWTAPLIEIELIVWGGDHNSGPVVEYITPPGMSASPVFSRIARINSTRAIYTSGLISLDAADGTGEVKQVFGELQRILQDAGSDLRHLAKATYYCSTDEASRKLNELRPSYYDAARPPSASKAMVTGVGKAGRGLNVDMIAVPAWDDATREYGPAEYGRGLTAEEIREGWLSLFDGISTFGWREAQIDEQGIFAGTSTTAFNDSRLRVEVSRAGTIKLGDETHPLTVGSHELKLPQRLGAVQLDASIRIRSLRQGPDGLKEIFNGTDLTGWQRIDRVTLPESARPNWSIVEGHLRAVGGPGAMEYVASQFGDFLLQVDLRTTVRHANGGVFFRAIPSDFMNGYEAQVYHRALNGDPARPATYSTGAIDDHQLARRLVSRDGQESTMTIVAQGPHIATWVNGAQMTDWTDTRAMHENPRQGLRMSAGAIQLQAHDPGTAVEFSRIRVKELRDGPR